MNMFIDFFRSVVGADVAYALVWSLVHSLWQAALVALAVAILTSLTRHRQASLRYCLHAIGLLSCVLLSAASFLVHFQRELMYLRLSDGAKLSVFIPTANELSWSTQASLYVNQHVSLLLLAWSLGTLMVGGAPLWDWRTSRRLITRDVSDLPAHWQTLCEQWQGKIGLLRPVRFLLSTKVDVPCVIAYFKPVVLLPASLLLGLSAQQIEAIVLHELAHIRRHDVAMANLQALIRAIYLFNPFVLWISRQLDVERENACDDIAASACRDPALYASSLLHFAEMRAHFDSSTRLAFVGQIGKKGKKMLLKHRIQRLFASERPVANTAKKTLSSTVILALLAASVSYAWAAHETTKTVHLNAQNLPLHQLLQQAERGCSGITEKIKLRHPEALVSANFANVACQDVPALFVDIEERFGMKFNQVEFHAALKVIQQQCPTMFRDVQLKHPQASFSINLQDKSCLQILDAVAEFDAKVK